MGGYSGFIKDTKQIHEFAVEIGRFIINFGTIEFLTHEILRVLFDEKSYKKSLNMDFSKRANMIIGKITNSNYSSDIKSKCLVAYQNSINLADVRAAISHNPVSYRECANENGEKSSAYEIIVMKYSKDGENFPTVNLDQINTRNTECVDTAEQLQFIYEAIKN